MNLVEQIWEDHQYLDRFDTIVTADDVTRFKPNPDPYLRALEKLRQEPENCLVVENAPAGIEAAKAAGLTCYAVASTLPPPYLQASDRIFPSLRALADHFFVSDPGFHRGDYLLRVRHFDFDNRNAFFSIIKMSDKIYYVN